MLAPIVVLGTTQAASRPRAIYVAGVDMALAVPTETITVTEAGVGGVSSMSFTIDDPSITYVLNEGDEVRFTDNTNNVPIFTGWIQAWSYRPDFGNLGRQIDVLCIGVDSILDNAVLTTSLTFTGFPLVQDCVLSIVANCTGISALRAFTDGALSSQAFPTGRPISGSAVIIDPLTITAGITLREAIRSVYDNSTIASLGIFTVATMIDMYWGLRTYILNDAGRTPTDWTTMTINDTSGGALISETMRHETNASEVIHSVYVVGGNAAGTGLVTDGTGKTGRVAVFSDSTILTAADRDRRGTNYLYSFLLAARGSFMLTDHTPVVTRHAGGLVVITDTRTSQNAAQYAIGQITKTYQPVRETWEVSFGGQAPSAMNSARRLTRSTLS